MSLEPARLIELLERNPPRLRPTSASRNKPRRRTPAMQPPKEKPSQRASARNPEGPAPLARALHPSTCLSGHRLAFRVWHHPLGCLVDIRCNIASSTGPTKRQIALTA